MVCCQTFIRCSAIECRCVICSDEAIRGLLGAYFRRHCDEPATGKLSIQDTLKCLGFGHAGRTLWVAQKNGAKAKLPDSDVFEETTLLRLMTAFHTISAMPSTLPASLRPRNIGHAVQTFVCCCAGVCNTFCRLAMRSLPSACFLSLSTKSAPRNSRAPSNASLRHSETTDQSRDPCRTPTTVHRALHPSCLGCAPSALWQATSAASHSLSWPTR